LNFAVVRAVKTDYQLIAYASIKPKEEELMRKAISYSFTACLVAALFGFSGAAVAKNDKSHGHRHGREFFSQTKPAFKIGDSDRGAIGAYLKKIHNRKCPPGLAKKNNGCLPPGIAKKYSIGKPLPDGIRFSPLPAELLKFLNPAPYGHKYVQVDKDILLINHATQNVIDAVTHLSAVGR
jgi:hypothetical protein